MNAHSLTFLISMMASTPRYQTIMVEDARMLTLMAIDVEMPFVQHGNGILMLFI